MSFTNRHHCSLKFLIKKTIKSENCIIIMDNKEKVREELARHICKEKSIEFSKFDLFSF